MDEQGFRTFLEEKSLNKKTVDNYCDYINATVEKYGVANGDELVETSGKVLEYIGKLVRAPMWLKVASARCYRRALCLLYEYKHNEELDKNLFPRWRAKDINDIKRVYRREHPEFPGSQWYQEIIVDDPQDWLEIIMEINGKDISGGRCWVFRGQGDAEWGLETSLGRAAHYEKGTGSEKGSRLRLFEKETMWEFKRESAKWPEYRGFEGVDLLALVQHYGGKTRLLDFSLAPLLALYMAVEQNETDFAKVISYKGLNDAVKSKLKQRDFAVWAVDLLRIVDASGCCDVKKTKTVEEVFRDAEMMLKNESEEREGIYAIFPKMCNERISAQDGLFLMPKSLDCSFEDNLRAELKDDDEPEKKFLGSFLSECDSFENGNESIEKRYLLPIVIKFVFPAALLEQVKALLAEANVTAKHVYPDLTGLGRYVSSIVEQHCQTEN